MWLSAGETFEVIDVFKSLNPCCRGCGSLPERFILEVEEDELCLNPCCRGCGSLPENELLQVMKKYMS